VGKKKEHHEGHVNHERWLVSYADFITLLFAFFVVMYAISDLNSKKAKTVSQSVRFAMHFSGSGGTNEPGLFQGRSQDDSEARAGGEMGHMEQWVRESTTVYEFLAKEMGGDFESGGEPKQRLDERGIVVSLPARWLFEANGVHLTPKADKYLTKLAEAARKYHKDILLSGLTARASFPEGGPFLDSVDLQLQRLARLERVLIDQLQWPADRVSITSLTKRSPSGSYASPSQVDRGATVDLVVLR
jgi:chemotaxis protein MotB